MQYPADLVIEVLNEPTVNQINSIGDFISRSKFWGSKWGVSDQGERGYQVLVEANHQRWWCPTYTSDTKYKIGQGTPSKGIPTDCGVWRCDTYVWWAFYSQGWNVMPGSIWLPLQVYNYFPYQNINGVTPKITETVLNRTLENITAEELNDLPIEEFQRIMDAPPENYITSHSAAQIQLANNPNLNDIKRGIMLDRLIADDAEPDLVKKLLKLYNETDNIEVKNSIVKDLMLYNQQHRKFKSYVDNEQPLLKTFFDQLLDAKSLTNRMTDYGLRGYIDTHSSFEIKSNLVRLDEWLSALHHTSSIMLKYSLSYKSDELQNIYIKSIIKELRKANDSDLDSYLFGPLSIAYQSTGKNLLLPESKEVIVEYLKEVQYKYTSNGIKTNPQDIHRITTTPYYFELLKYMSA